MCLHYAETNEDTTGLFSMVDFGDLMKNLE